MRHTKGRSPGTQVWCGASLAKDPKLCLPGRWGLWKAAGSGKEDHPDTPVAGMHPRTGTVSLSGRTWRWKGVLTTMATHVDLQELALGAACGTGGRQTRRWGRSPWVSHPRRPRRGFSTLAAGTVVEEVGLQVPLALRVIRCHSLCRERRLLRDGSGRVGPSLEGGAPAAVWPPPTQGRHGPLQHEAVPLGPPAREAARPVTWAVPSGVR